MKKSIYFVGLAMLAGSFLTGCQESYEDVSDHNQIWLPGNDPVTMILLDGRTDEVTKDLNVTLAQPVDFNIRVKYDTSPQRVNEYNAIYGAEAELLPASYYTFQNREVTIEAGAVNSSSTQIDFKDLSSLDISKTYVLPVEIAEANMSILAGQDVNYYVVRGAALINVVGNMTNTCLRFVNEGDCPMLSNLSQFTVECLIYPDAFENTLSTLIGIEDKFLIRIGDVGIEKNQLQIATSDGKVTNDAWLVETGKWTFLTIAFDLEAHQMSVYFNGLLKGKTETIPFSGPVDWNVVSFDRACYIGYSYEPGRDFQGNMSEVRVWDKVLGPANLGEPNHFYHVDPSTPGLVAYWKFNEGAGNRVHDYANGYDMYVPAEWPDTGDNATVPGDIHWVPVSLPEE